MIHLPQWNKALSTATIKASSGMRPFSAMALLITLSPTIMARPATRSVPPGNEEDQANAGILLQFVQSIHAPVAPAIRNGNGRIVKAFDESGVVCLGRQIDHAERIGRTNHDERRRRDKFPTAPIEPRQHRAGEPPVGRPDDLPQILLGRDHLIKPRIARQCLCVHVPALGR